MDGRGLGDPVNSGFGSPSRCVPKVSVERGVGVASTAGTQKNLTLQEERGKATQGTMQGGGGTKGKTKGACDRLGKDKFAARHWGLGRVAGKNSRGKEERMRGKCESQICRKP